MDVLISTIYYEEKMDGRNNYHSSSHLSLCRVLLALFMYIFLPDDEYQMTHDYK